MIEWISLDVLKAVAVLMLARIAVSDYLTQRIRNEHMWQLFAVAIAILLITFAGNRDALAAGFALAMSLLLFVILLVFWLLGKVGAGDVKLLATMPLLLGYGGSMPFMLALLVFTFIVYFIMKFPNLLPERWHRGYIQSIAATGRVPFGVPIAAAAIVAVLIPTNLLLGPPPWQRAAAARACAALPADQLQQLLNPDSPC
jgi:prepilin peptidase CpaA